MATGRNKWEVSIEQIQFIPLAYEIQHVRGYIIIVADIIIAL